LHGELGTRNQIIDVRQHIIEAVVDGVDIHGDGDVMLARDFRGTRDGGRIVPVDVEQLGASDFLGRDAGRIETQAFVALPKNRSLAGGPIDQDVRGLVGAVGADLDVIEVDAGLAQALELNLTAIVIAHRSDVFHREPELGARNHGAGHLAAGAQNFLFECDLPGIRGKMREHDEGVGGVEAHADYVELRHEVTGYRRQKAGGRSQPLERLLFQ